MKRCLFLVVLVACQSQPENRIVTSDPNRAVLCSDVEMLQQLSSEVLAHHGASTDAQMALASAYAKARSACQLAGTSRPDAGAVDAGAGTQ